MKKKMIVLLAAALLALGASNAMAYFDDLNLVRIVYNDSTGNETATDLGNITTLLGDVAASSTGMLTVGNGANAFTTGAGLGASADANLHVTYMVANAFTDNQLWLSAAKGITVKSATNSFTTLNTAMTNIFFVDYGNVGAYNNPQTVSTVFPTDTNNYQYQMVGGDFQSFFQNTLSGEASLATLASGSIEQGLYYWADGTVNTTGSAVNVNGQTLSILTNADGSTTLVGAPPTPATPIPPAFFLMGSGLLGMFGLRRKQRG